MGAVRRMKLNEGVQVDGAFLSEVMAQLGPTAAQSLINEALGTLAIELRALGELRRRLDAGEAVLADMVQSCDRLSRMAWEMGLTTLSGVAVDLGLCIEGGDTVALRAVEARLQRVGSRSLLVAWDEAAFG